MAQILRIMQISSLLMLAFCLSLSAKSISQNVTFTGKNIPLERVFTAIEKQTGYLVVYDQQMLRQAKSVTVNVRQQPLMAFMKNLLDGQPYGFTIEGNTIFIKNSSRKNQAPDNISKEMFLPITGVVTNESGQPLVGTTVRVKGKNTSTLTSETGQFLINAAAGDILIISYVGYKTKEVKISTDAPIQLIMEQQERLIDTMSVVVNTGYQSISRERATGSYSIVTARQMENKLKPDLKSALEGQVAGLVLTKEGNLEIRGVSTFQSITDRAPLLIVDGYPISGGMETLNIDNIESVTVLKDAVAASIYGSRSSNGVIVVTTKQAKKGTLQVGYSGVAGIILKPELSYLNRTSSADFIELEKEMYASNPNSYSNTFTNYGYLSRVMYLQVAKARGLIDATVADAEIEALKGNDGLGQLEKYYFRNQGSQQHNISLSSGTDKNLVSATAKYITTQGSSIHTDDQRLILDVKNDWKPTQSLTIRLLSNINYAKGQTPVRTSNELLTFYSNSSNLRPYDLIVNPSTGMPQDVFSINPRLSLIHI